MAYADHTLEQIRDKADAIYQHQIRAKVEAEHNGRFIVIDVESGDYEIADKDLTATKRMLKRRPDGVLHGLRIGHAAPYRIGCSLGNQQ